MMEIDSKCRCSPLSTRAGAILHSSNVSHTGRMMRAEASNSPTHGSGIPTAGNGRTSSVVSYLKRSISTLVGRRVVNPLQNGSILESITPHSLRHLPKLRAKMA
ncbi:hypothetical protein AB1N83_002106 [Pleurotus pulmonarius]